ncbi:MAG TPA: class I SAM-dependent methyltransferase [Thermoleophilaceae bacterium]|nr:class I SAM-dependent methyltransferase [Thermoleophilaceae bacterium]
MPAESVKHPLFARGYAWLAKKEDKAGNADNRRELLAGLKGSVVEVGAGIGSNFEHYPETVTEVIAVEPEPYLRQKAEAAAADAPVPVRVVEGLADALPLEDASVDAGVASLVLCSVPDQETALAELHRTIRSGGELRFFEHVVSNRKSRRRMQRVLDKTFYPRVAGGCHLTRDTRAAIEDAGFIVRRSRRFQFPSGNFGLPHILGSARRP